MELVIMGINIIKLISSPTQAINQEFDEIEIKVPKIIIKKNNSFWKIFKNSYMRYELISLNLAY
jgi:hypothetical protein